MAIDHYEKGKPLRRTGIFQILAEEAWRDGEFSKADSAMLEAFRRYLRLKNQRAMEILDLAQEKYRSGRIGTLRDFSARQCYARALRYAFSDDAELSPKEDKYLRGLRATIGLTDRDHQKVVDRLRSKGWSPGSPAGAGDSAIQVLDSGTRARLVAAAAAMDPDVDVLEPDPTEVPPPVPVLAPTEDTEDPEDPDEPADRVPSPTAPGPTVRKASRTAEEAIEDAIRSVDEPIPVPVPTTSSPGTSSPTRTSTRSPMASRAAEEAPPPRVPRPGKRKRRNRRDPSRDSLSIANMRGHAFRVGVFLLAAGLGLALLQSLPGGAGTGTPAEGAGLRDLAARFGTNEFQVQQLVVKGPEPPAGPPLDLGEAWDLHAGLDGQLYGTASYRIFRIDPKTGKAEWIAGTGRLGEPEDGKKALECLMDPASPRVDRDGIVYFRQGSASIHRIDKDGTVRRVLGTREARVAWQDGDEALAAKPGALEQIEVDAAGRVYFDEYSGEASGPEILGRVEIDGRLRALFLFALTPIEQPYRRLMKTFVGTGNGFENLHFGADGGLYFSVGDRLYSWHSGEGPPQLILQNPPIEYAVLADGSLLVAVENRIERWVDPKSWTGENRNVEVVAGGNPDGVPSVRYASPIPGPAAGFVQPRDLTLGPDGTLFVLDGAAGGTGVSQPRIDMIRRSAAKSGK